MAEWRVRILHVSDLHERGPHEKEPWRRRRVLGASWADNIEALLKDGPIDLVCFTGDIADRGKAEEYGSATEFFGELLKATGLGMDRLFLVPGNHDVDRNLGKAAWEEVRQKAFRVPTVEFSHWVAGGATPLGFEADYHSELLSRSAAFRDWLARLGCTELSPAASPHGHLGYRRKLQLPDRPFPVHIIGLDSAWLAGDDHDDGKLRLTDGQIGALARDDKGEALQGFKLGLVHHPLAALADEAECRPLLADNLHLRVPPPDGTLVDRPVAERWRSKVPLGGGHVRAERIDAGEEGRLEAVDEGGGARGAGRVEEKRFAAGNVRPRAGRWG